MIYPTYNLIANNLLSVTHFTWKLYWVQTLIYQFSAMRYVVSIYRCIGISIQLPVESVLIYTIMMGHEPFTWLRNSGVMCCCNYEVRTKYEIALRLQCYSEMDKIFLFCFFFVRFDSLWGFWRMLINQNIIRYVLKSKIIRRGKKKTVMNCHSS